MRTKSVQKFITFSPELYRLAVSRASRFGLSIGEYLRHLIVEDVKEEVKVYPMVDTETGKSVGRALKDVHEGRYETLSTHKEIDNYFDKLNKQALKQ